MTQKSSLQYEMFGTVPLLYPTNDFLPFIIKEKTTQDLYGVFFDNEKDIYI
jgi:hypothetical protein